MSNSASAPFQDEDFTLKQPIDVRELLDKYVYHWPVFLLSLILSICLAFLYLRYTPKIYVIKSTLLIKDERSSSDPLKQFNMFPDTRVIQNEMEILHSKNLMNQVVRDLDLNIIYKTKGRATSTDVYTHKPFNIVFADKNRITSGKWEIQVLDNFNYTIIVENVNTKLHGRFGSQLNTSFGSCIIQKTAALPAYIGSTIYMSFEDGEAYANKILGNLVLLTVNNNADVIDLNLNDEVPERGKDILNDLINVYNEAAIEDKNKAIINSIRFIKERLNFIGNQLNDAEQKEQNYKSSHGINDVSSRAQVFEDNVKENDSKLNEVNLQLSSLEEITNFVNSPRRTDDIPSLIGVSDPVVLSQVSQLSSLLDQQERLLETTGPSNPIVKQMDKHIQKINHSIIKSISNLRAALNRNKAQLVANNAKFEASIRTIPEEEKQLVAIQRDKGIKESLYNILLQKQEEASLSSATTTADSRIVEPPYCSNIPIKPQAGTIYLLAVVFGIFLPIGYVFIKDALNFRVISHKDITDRTSVPIIGDILYLEDVPPVIIVSNNSRTIIAEQFRTIRTNLHYIFNNQRGAKVTLFTSNMPGEGKSFIATNMAAALAITDRKTVILELDLRKPRISQYMKQRSKIGLSNYLIGEVSKESIVHPSEIHPNLYLISSGPIPPNPSELLEHERIDELVKWLKTEFAEIIIDTPPIGLVTDALVLSRLTDVTIYVVRHGVTLKNQINAVEALYQQKKFPKLNIVLNGVKHEGRFGYSYEGQYGYKYGQGYSNSYYIGEPEKKKSFKLPSFFRNFLNRF